MATGSWDPGTGTTQLAGAPAEGILRRFVALGCSDNPRDLASQLSEQERQLAPCMRLPEAAWQAALANFGEADLIALVRFFTCAEMQLPGWQAGANSPVIAINRILRQRGHKLDRAMLQWIRENSDNRFLPNGPVELG